MKSKSIARVLAFATIATILIVDPRSPDSYRELAGDLPSAAEGLGPSAGVKTVVQARADLKWVVPGVAGRASIKHRGPSDSMWRVYEETGFNEILEKVPTGTPVWILTWEYLQTVWESKGSFLGFKEQIVSRNTEFEERLLEASDLESRAHEVGRFRLFSKGRVFEGALFHGVQIHVGGAEILANLRATIKSARESGFPLDELDLVEFNHTHPAYGFQVEGSKEIYAHDLSFADIETAYTYSGNMHLFVEVPRLEGVPFAMRAILPNGYTFTKRFVRGRPEGDKAPGNSQPSKPAIDLDQLEI